MPRERMDRSLNVKDISEPKRIRPRDTNPLDPNYRCPTNAVTSLHAKYAEEHNLGTTVPPTEPVTHGEIHGSKPRKLQWDNGEPQLSLLREDIAGTVPQRWVGSVPQNIYDPPEVRPMMSFHDPHDIPGAQVGSLKKGIVTGRACNPLNPRYPMLDGNTGAHPVPIMEAERGYARPPHPMMASRAAASSLPDLHSSGRGAQPGRMMSRDASDFGTQRMPEDSQRSSRAPSGRASPAGSRMGDPHMM
jgi:hypothetical protein